MFWIIKANDYNKILLYQMYKFIFSKQFVHAINLPIPSHNMSESSIQTKPQQMTNHNGPIPYKTHTMYSMES